MATFEVYSRVIERGAFITREYNKLIGTIQATSATEAALLLNGDYAVLLF